MCIFDSTFASVVVSILACVPGFFVWLASCTVAPLGGYDLVCYLVVFENDFWFAIKLLK